MKIRILRESRQQLGLGKRIRRVEDTKAAEEDAERSEEGGEQGIGNFRFRKGHTGLIL